MKRNKSESQELYNFVIAKAFQQSVGSMFTYSELRNIVWFVARMINA